LVWKQIFELCKDQGNKFTCVGLTTTSIRVWVRVSSLVKNVDSLLIGGIKNGWGNTYKIVFVSHVKANISRNDDKSVVNPYVFVAMVMAMNCENIVKHI